MLLKMDELQASRHLGHSQAVSGVRRIIVLWFANEPIDDLGLL